MLNMVNRPNTMFMTINQRVLRLIHTSSLSVQLWLRMKGLSSGCICVYLTARPVRPGKGASWPSSASQCGSTNAYHEAAPYQIHQASDRCRPLPNPTRSHAHGADPIGGLGLVWVVITIAYHCRDLGRNLPRGCFTNHYHRGEETRYYRLL